MFESFVVFHIGGAILWSRNLLPPRKSPINTLIHSVLLEKRNTSPFSVGQFSCYWKRVNNPDLVFAAVCQSIMTVVYADKLLDTISSEFLHKYMNILSSPLPSLFPLKLDFDDLYNVIVEKLTKPKEVPSLPPSSPSFNPPVSPLPPSIPQVVNPPTPTSTETSSKQPQIKKSGKKMRGKGGKEVVDTDILDYSSKSEPITSSLDYGQSERINIDAGFRTQSNSGKSVWNLFSSLTGGVITSQNLDKILPKFREILVEKNVAAEVADRVIMSVQSNLIGKSAPFGGLQSMVKQSLAEVIGQILTPSRNIDLLREIKNHVSHSNSPYSVVFCGVNGVGKSTNLAKIAFYLKQNGIKVLIAACDTFRSGAVEQLRVHSSNLGVELFSRDYGTSPASVARAALEMARRDQYDCVLIDTAGRMQDNEPLMASLAELVSKNNPNMILMVLECLAGHDAVDQLSKFDSSLVKRVTGLRNGRGIDGILLTKFDTVDTKVGTALSITYISGKPVVFVGVGQNYTNLLRFDVESVLECLVS
ncbi:hypothetical protein RCL1_004654 [Eukaryota sp. TZLM3-RCL]